MSPAPKTVKDLPIYVDVSETAQRTLLVELVTPKSDLETAVASARSQACALMSQYKTERQNAAALYDKTKAQLNTQLEYVRSETNIIPKVAFISLSGLSGLLIGFRRGIFRKLVYSTVLGGAAAAACFPAETRAYSNRVRTWEKQFATGIYQDYIKSSNNKKPVPAPVPTPAASETVSNDGKDQIIKLDNASTAGDSTKQVKGDLGQSSEADKDMYTTRSK